MKVVTHMLHTYVATIQLKGMAKDKSTISR